MESLEGRTSVRIDGICARIDGLKEVLDARVKVGGHSEIVPGV